MVYAVPTPLLEDAPVITDIHQSTILYEGPSDIYQQTILYAPKKALISTSKQCCMSVVRKATMWLFTQTIQCML